MFTLEEIKAAHSKVRSGADFPQYVQDIIGLGVTHYDTFVVDGHTDYYGENGVELSSDSKYENLAIAESPNASEFRTSLKEHQEGKTDYLTFTRLCAQLGINKWNVALDVMTCTYFDKGDNVILIEKIQAIDH